MRKHNFSNRKWSYATKLSILFLPTYLRFTLLAAFFSNSFLVKTIENSELAYLRVSDSFFLIQITQIQKPEQTFTEIK